MENSILERIKEADNLPSLPTVAVEVLRLTKADDASMDELVRAIQSDPALTGKILRVVNSSLFGIPREISSIKQAVGLLGLRTINVMALSFSLVEMIKTDSDNRFDYDGYWRRSISCAVAARLLAKAVAPRLAEEAFVAGLLADIGMIAAWRCADANFNTRELLANDATRPLSDVEQETHGISHARLGQELLQTWGLPDVLATAVGAHHGEIRAAVTSHSKSLTQVLAAAADIAAVFCQDMPSEQLERVKASCIESTGIAPTDLEALLADIDTHVRETAATFSLSVGETLDYARIQLEGTAQLAQMSMQAEMERAQATRKAQAAVAEAERLNGEKKAILELAAHDALTKLANRAEFDRRLDEEVARARAQGHPLGMIMLDIDHFKHCNDTHGHQAGDAVLRRVGQTIQEVVHNIGFAARYGGEEFAIILTGEATSNINALAEQIRGAIAATPAYHNEQQLRITASLGTAVAAAASETISAARLIEAADMRMYRAKQGGRNRVEAATEQPGKRPTSPAPTYRASGVSSAPTRAATRHLPN
ncbi:MAG: GGDEF domain-containing protein [Phycisphaerae bacterium]|nr:GGDEF domain-containing protein [Phycisphaerae bacterium]